MTAADAPAVRELFIATAAMGRPLTLPPRDLAAYSALCLDHYLTVDGRACAVLEEDGRVTGYLMVALDHEAFERWLRPQALRWAARAVLRAGWESASAFHRCRLQDGWVTMRHRVPPPMPAHVHVNVRSGRRGVAAGFALIAHADAVVGAAGLPGYFGEVNVPVAKPGRAGALVRLGGQIVHRQRNHTLSWLAGEPVDRLTVVRSLDPAAGWRPLPGSER